MFSPEIIQAIKTHAVREYPSESCGVVSADKYLEFENTDENPEEHFRINTEAYTRTLVTTGVQAVIHSHPNGPDCPTKHDMESQIATAVPWGIVTVNPSGPLEPFFFGDQVPMAPLLARSFRMGVHDCYSLVRDWFLLNSHVELPVFPREPLWWEKEGENVLADNFYGMGFREIDKIERIGDCVLTKIKGDVENHCGLYLGMGLVLHHKPGKLSLREPGDKWLRRPRSRFFRHKDFEPAENMEIVWEAALK